MKLLKKNSRRGCTAKTSISATAEEVTEKAVATKAAAMVTVADAAMRVKDMEKVAAMKERETRKAAADMVKDITKAAAATGKKTNSRECGFYSRLYLQRF